MFLSPGTALAITFLAKTDFATGLGPQSVAIRDFNGDGKPDLAVANNTASTVSILLQAPDTSVGGVALDPELAGSTPTRVQTEADASYRLIYGALAGALALAVLVAVGRWYMRASRGR